MNGKDTTRGDRQGNDIADSIIADNSQRPSHTTTALHYANQWQHKISSHTPHIDERTIPYISYQNDTIMERTHETKNRSYSSKGSTPVATIIAHYDHNSGKPDHGPSYMSKADFKLVIQKLGLHINDAAIQTINTNVSLPDEVKLILAFGPKFSVPIPFNETKQKLLMHAIQGLNRFHMSVYEQRAVTQITREHIERTKTLGNIHRHPTDTQQFLVHCYNCVMKFFTENSDHIIAQADKGNITLVMPKIDYVNKLEQHLADTSTYERITQSSHVGYSKRNELLLQKMTEYHAFPRNKIPGTVAAECKIPNMYGLIKLHKENAPIRPVVNTRSGPGYALARILTNIFTGAQETHKYNVKNSFDVIERIAYITPDPDEFFASFDIQSMFTNITTDMAIASIQKRYNAGKFKTQIPLQWIIETTRFVISYATEIEFNGTIYKQIRGLRMGSSLSSILADFVTEDILDDTFTRIERPKLFTKYVDDCLILARLKHIEEIGTMLNEGNEKIIFETEAESDDGHINYLDINIHNTHECQIYTKWFHKPMASGRFLNFCSSHPRATIINTAKCYVYNIFCISHTRFHPEMTCKIAQLLKVNNYPIKIASDIIREAYEKWNTRDKAEHRFEAAHTLPQDNDPFEFAEVERNDTYDSDFPKYGNPKALDATRTYASIPYYAEITPQVQKTIREIRPNLMTTGKPMSTMRQIYNRHKNLQNESGTRDTRSPYSRRHIDTVGTHSSTTNTPLHTKTGSTNMTDATDKAHDERRWLETPKTYGNTRRNPFRRRF